MTQSEREPVPIFSRKGEPIGDLADWERVASSKGKWADGFSAKELAKLWLHGHGPAAARCARARPARPVSNRAIAEAKIGFDTYAGGVRNHDVLAFGVSDLGEVVVGIDDLCDSILGRSLNADPSLADLRYQLLSAIAGTAAAATTATAAAAVVVRLIRSPHANPAKFAETRNAVSDLCAALGLDSDGGAAGPVILKKPPGESSLGMPIWLVVIETEPAEGRST